MGRGQKSRPSQPAVEDGTLVSGLWSFSPLGQWFAYVSLAVDKHRLRVYDTLRGHALAETVLESARVCSLAWASDQETVILGLSDGSVHFFSPLHGKLIRALSHPSSATPILSLATGQASIWTSSADATLRLWDSEANTILGSWKMESAHTAQAIRPSTNQLLVASHSIRLLDLTQKPTVLASFTGHPSPVKILQWDSSQLPPNRFISMAEADRILSVWEFNDDPKMVASVQLDSDARGIALSHSTLLTIAASGKVSLYPIPKEIPSLSTLLPKSVIPPKGPKVVAASFLDGQPGRLRIARIVGGVKPVFDIIQYLNESGDYISHIPLAEIKSGILVHEVQMAPPNKRYRESTAVPSSGQDLLGQDEEMEHLASKHVEGHLDIDVADLSLGQRLTALSGPTAPHSDSDSEDPHPTKKSSRDPNVVPAKSLTRTLIQALHSSDSKLLETCLAHSDSTLIHNTVKRLPPQLAVPLLNACVERLGRGNRAANMKGAGGGASSQRGQGLVVWVKAVLVVHSAHLMTMPDLIARLSSLHATLTSRLALQESLLSLTGRLDMVLSQIELRSSTAPAPLTAKVKQKEVKRYVEGESEDEDEQMDVQVEVGEDDEGSVEDVDLGGGSSDEEEESAEETDDDEDSEDDDDEGPTMNGFIDDEAEDEYTEDEDDDESE